MLPAVNFASGLTSGVVAITLCSPLDVARTRLQVQGTLADTNIHRKQSFLNIFKNVYREEGIHGFFRGYRASIVSVPIFQAVYFPLYQFTKQKTREIVGCERDSICESMCAAAFAGTVCNVLTNPLWVLRVRMQTAPIHGNNHKYKYFLPSLKRIIRNEGFQALYKGLVPSLFGVVHVLVQFPLYEYLKVEEKRKRNLDSLPTMMVFRNVVISKLCASMFSYPHEVLRARLQDSTQRDGLLDICKRTIHREGYSGFYRGFFVNLFRIIPQNAIIFMVYEYMSYALSDLYKN